MDSPITNMWFSKIIYGLWLSPNIHDVHLNTTWLRAAVLLVMGATHLFDFEQRKEALLREAQQSQRQRPEMSTSRRSHGDFWSKKTRGMGKWWSSMGCLGWLWMNYGLFVENKRMAILWMIHCCSMAVWPVQLGWYVNGWSRFWPGFFFIYAQQ